MRITFISDTHNKHNQITKDLPGGDIIIHAGDISSMGYNHEIKEFCKWYDSLDNYTHKVFIAGNHDWGFLDREKFFVYRDAFVPDQTQETLNSFKNFDYLRDNLIDIDSVKIYGSPWQPEFFDWAFNLPKGGSELKMRWDNIPDDTDILITHGPAYGYLDRVIGRYDNLGCELLTQRIKEIKPKIHVCGHIHSGRNLLFDNGILYINASVLNERYEYNYKPITIDFNFNTLEYNIINI